LQFCQDTSFFSAVGGFFEFISLYSHEAIVLKWSELYFLWFLFKLRLSSILNHCFYCWRTLFLLFTNVIVPSIGFDSVTPFSFHICKFILFFFVLIPHAYTIFTRCLHLRKDTYFYQNKNKVYVLAWSNLESIWHTELITLFSFSLPPISLDAYSSWFLKIFKPAWNNT